MNFWTSYLLFTIVPIIVFISFLVVAEVRKRRKEKEKERREDKYRKQQDKNRYKEGDMVMVMRKAESYERGWSEEWNSYKDKYVGKVLEVAGYYGRSRGVALFTRGDYYESFPFFILKKVLPSDMIEINGKKVLISKLKELLQDKRGLDVTVA